MPDREKVLHELDHQVADADWCDNDWKDNVPIWMLRGALALLKEQEPKPVKVKKNAYNHEFYHCPNCDREFYGPYKRPNYCDQCGQAVKWNEAD